MAFPVFAKNDAPAKILSRLFARLPMKACLARSSAFGPARGLPGLQSSASDKLRCLRWPLFWSKAGEAPRSHIFRSLLPLCR
jgi:hypothetical protein